MKKLMILVSLVLLASGMNVKKLKKECDNGNGKNCYELSQQKNMSVETREYYLDKSCKLDYVKSCFLLGIVNNFSCMFGYKDSCKSSLEYFEKGCKLNDGFCCKESGKFYFQDYSEVGIKQDYFRAFNYFKKACNLNEAEGCKYLGYLYESGKGIRQNINLAVKYYKKGCKLKDGESCKNISKLYYKNKNFVLALKYSKKACDLNNSDGCVVSGVFLTNSFNGIQKNTFQGFKYIKKGCDLNNSISCNMVGELYKKGIGTKQSYPKAKYYYGKACDLKIQKGCENYSILNSQGY